MITCGRERADASASEGGGRIGGERRIAEGEGGTGVVEGGLVSGGGGARDSLGLGFETMSDSTVR